jgi:hypothetical protein
MARQIDISTQVNLWGKATDQTVGLVPQRSDLFYVDFRNAVRGINATGASPRPIDPASILPQFVRSTTLPENRLKPETVRRDSVPYNMPSWDDPLDPVKVVFLMSNSDDVSKNDLISVLDTWLKLTRAGRGSRQDGYGNSGYVLLNSNYSIDYTFDVSIHLLRGTLLNASNTAANTSNARVMAVNNEIQRHRRKAKGLAQMGKPIPKSIQKQLASSPGAVNNIVETGMTIDATWIMYNAWIGGYKLSDLNTAETGLVTVEATFYTEAFERNDALSNQL